MTGTDKDPLRKYHLTRMSRKTSSKNIFSPPTGDVLSTPQQSQPQSDLPLVICKTCGLQDRKYFLVTYGLKHARTGWYCTRSPTNRARKFSFVVVGCSAWICSSSFRFVGRGVAKHVLVCKKITAPEIK
ncbi:hypothetical protein TNIN_387571 [Trichonephila inaurata madagascariensis]|uniref:Uncharacterized protein n=1 Tax=Trichonephila inaurata madagascariensis TaxID=2747483 RepID=A0A8X6X3D1_9ARAC|nr:hypothetical protein TNIN_387571 [Trichonephila inaurata madagascariensis]